MARTVTPLTDPKCEAAKPRDKDYKLFDGQGLFLLVKPSGVKTWRLKFTRPDGREGLATFGNYPALGLKAARERRAEALELLAIGRDPVEAARLAKVEAATARTPSRRWPASGTASAPASGSRTTPPRCCAGWSFTCSPPWVRDQWPI